MLMFRVVVGLLLKAIVEAHNRTCLYNSDQISAMKSQELPSDQLAAYREMVGSSNHIITVV